MCVAAAVAGCIVSMLARWQFRVVSTSFIRSLHTHCAPAPSLRPLTHTHTFQTLCYQTQALPDADPAQISAFLVLLRAKGETAAEMAGMAR